jgi:predicted transcriptional regulator
MQAAVVGRDQAGAGRKLVPANWSDRRRVYNAAMDSEDWQLAEIEAGIEDLDNGRTVCHDEVVTWLRSWGEPTEGKAPK